MAISMGFEMTSRFAAFKMRKTSDIWPARRFPRRPSGQIFRHPIEKGEISRNVGGSNGVADAIERDLGAFHFVEQRIFHGFTLDGVAQSSHKMACVDLAYD